VSATQRVDYRTCPLCEATCGLELTLEGDDVTAIRGDRDDVFSHGFVCPKGATLEALHADPDRVRTPLLRRPDGSFAPASWDAAFAFIDERLGTILAGGDRNAVGAYVGNPSAHNLDAQLYGRVLLKALGTRNVFSASTLDQMPKQVAAGLMFGAGLSVPIPDVDRTDHMLILGANPLASNGSLLTAPDMRGRLRAIRARGGRVVVVDPRRSRTAAEADEHLFIRPGADAAFLMALVHVLFAERLASPGPLAEHLEGIEAVEQAASAFTPERASAACGIPAETIARTARELAGAKRAVVYGRIGTCTQEFGTLASWLVDVLNALTGNLDREGGAMFPRAAAGQSNSSGLPGGGRGVRFGRWHSRVRGLGEAFGELPTSCLAEEIETPGEGRIRALLTLAGNPVLSSPNAGRLDRALESLELMVSIDVYVNETTRHADVILPAPSPLRRAHYDLAFYQLSVRDIANFSPRTLPADPELPDEWVTLLRLAGIATGQGPAADVGAIDDFVTSEAVRRAVATPGSPVEGRDAGELLNALSPRTGPERLLDLLLRTGPYGEGFGAPAALAGRTPGGAGLSLEVLEQHPHGIDLGALEPRIPEVLRTPSGRVELAPEPILADVPRLKESLDRAAGMVLIGRRLLRSNNSWMHNLVPLVRGKDGCTLHVHPRDAARAGLADGGRARVTSRAGTLVAPVEVTEDVMEGVVSLPHGWGHDAPGAVMEVAARHAGVNTNLLADEQRVDPLSGNAILNGIPVKLEAAPAAGNGPSPAGEGAAVAAAG